MTTGTETAMKVAKTRGEVVFEKAQDLARIAAERATTKDWTKHPMWGIAVDTDKWATAYQEKLRELAELLMPNTESTGAALCDRPAKTWKCWTG